MASKPLILSDSITLVDKDLTNVYRHWTKNGKETQLPCDVKFKKKEEVNTLGKALLKHRIYALTGKNLPTIENEMGQNLEKVEDLKCFAKILLHEAFEKLPKIAAPEPVGEPMDTSVPVNRRKRGFNDDSGSNGGEAEIEPSRKRGRKSIAVTPSSTPTRSSRRSIAPELLRKAIVKEPEPEIEEQVTEEDEEEEEEELDLTELGPNPTPQMIELLKRKKMSAKKSPKKKVNGSAKINNSPKVTKNDLSISMPIPRKKPQPPPQPALPYFPGDKDAKIFFVEGDPSRFSANDFVKIPKANLESFQGVNFTFLHTPVDWKPTDIFKLFQSVRTVNQKAGLESYLIMIGCGISNVESSRQAFMSFTEHVQLVIFEKTDLNLENEANSKMLRETTTMFLLGYIYPGCLDGNKLPPAPMVRPNLTNIFKAKSSEDLENTVIHAFTEEADWIFDICCGSRELSLAAQKSGRNAIAFDKDRGKLEEVALKAIAISEHHDAKFRPDTDGKVLTV